MKINAALTCSSLASQLDRFFELSGQKILKLERRWKPANGSPVYTVKGHYSARGWTEWTQGFMYGCQLLQFDATGDRRFLEMGRSNTQKYMPPHLSHIGVHDHGFNNISTYGNLRRLALEGKSGDGIQMARYCELAIMVSGAVQAARWSNTIDGTGFIHSFNGPHSLFSDTIRTCRILSLSHQLGHCLMGENDTKISLLQRAAEHIENTSKYNVWYGKGRDIYDLRGRVAHEGIFNMKDGRYRCPSTQQGYSAFSTWTRGLAWVLLGSAEQLEFFTTLSNKETDIDMPAVKKTLLNMARATGDFYIENTTTDGIPLWDTGAPGVANMPGYLKKVSQPDNPWEPFDSSAAAISAQGLLRLGRYIGLNKKEGKKYFQAGLTVARSIFKAPYLSEDPKHEGLLLHSIYHQPNGWDYIPKGKKVPQGESSMWGDYHAMELAVYLKRLNDGDKYLAFFDQD
jgi:unsaturated chondroitin disaccharide hydrolase